MPKSWKDQFDKRELEEIEFCITYQVRFGHDPLGHNMRKWLQAIIAKMAAILDSNEMENYAEAAKAKKHGNKLYDIEYAEPDNPFKRVFKTMCKGGPRLPTPIIHEKEVDNPLEPIFKGR